jgi:hypothetical protein
MNRPQNWDEHKAALLHTLELKALQLEERAENIRRWAKQVETFDASVSGDVIFAREHDCNINDYGDLDSIRIYQETSFHWPHIATAEYWSG